MRPRTATLLSALVLVLAGMVPASPADAKTKAPVITGLRCVPKTLAACRSGIRLMVGQRLQFSGRDLKRGMRVTFRWSRGALATKLTFDKVGWTVRVPAGTTSGTLSVYLTDRAGRRSNTRKVRVVSAPSVTLPKASSSAGLPAAFDGNGMWIWYVDKSDRGDIAAIAARAKAANVTTVFVKSADGATPWTQFTPALVNSLHALGIKVCAWQFVYGANPTGEAGAAAATIAAGADCFVIDAESQYEGRYAAAQTYMTSLRSLVGDAYPIGLTSFPYVDYHPRLPYSVFMGDGGAQVNLPQVYWKDIGGTVDAVSSKTFANNRIYGRPIAPLGQTYNSPSNADLGRFRAIWAGYGSGGLSWWSWQETSNAEWSVLNQPTPAPIVAPDPGWPPLSKGSSGDQVIWLQQHLATAVPSVSINGKFTAATATALSSFQTARGLTATGETDPATWQALLTLARAPVDWS